MFFHICRQRRRYYSDITHKGNMVYSSWNLFFKILFVTFSKQACFVKLCPHSWKEFCLVKVVDLVSDIIVEVFPLAISAHSYRIRIHSYRQIFFHISTAFESIRISNCSFTLVLHSDPLGSRLNSQQWLKSKKIYFLIFSRIHIRKYKWRLQ